MKIGILTFHEGLNHGAYLQAYCTMLTLRALGHDPVIINYKNREHWMKEDVRPWLAYRRPVRFFDRFRKEKAFRTDLKKMPLTAYTRDSAQVRRQHFDAVVFGSDVVWDTGIFGYDPLYFGDVKADLRIAFAASCGKTSQYGVHEGRVRAQLKQFDHISVRDRNTERLVSEMTGTVPPVVLDPVFLPEHLVGLINDGTVKEQIPSEPFILVYGTQYADEDVRFIRTFTEKRGLKVISVGNRNLWADRSVLSVGPLSILNWFGAADFVFSSTFHGAIFAIRNEKNFAVRIHSSIQNKVTSLLELLGLPERGADEMNLLHDTLSVPVDYGPVNEVIERERSRSFDFLNSALSR